MQRENDGISYCHGQVFYITYFIMATRFDPKMIIFRGMI